MARASLAMSNAHCESEATYVQRHCSCRCVKDKSGRQGSVRERVFGTVELVVEKIVTHGGHLAVQTSRLERKLKASILIRDHSARQ